MKTLASAFISAIYLLAISTQAWAELLEVGDSEMGQVTGGVTVEAIEDMSSGTNKFGYDNIPLKVKVASQLGEPYIDVLSYAEGTKVGHHNVYVGVGGSGGVDRTTILERTKTWPLGVGPQTLNFKFCSFDLSLNYTCTQSVLGGKTKEVRLLNSVAVTKVHVYKVKDSTYMSSYTFSTIENTFDNTSYAYTSFTDTADAYLAQCPSNMRWQMRFASKSLAIVPDGCTSTTQAPDDSWRCAGMTSHSLLSRYEAVAAVKDPSRNDLHVFFLRDLENKLGESVLGIAYDNRNLIFIDDNVVGELFLRTIVHEFGHTRNLVHVDIDPVLVPGPGGETDPCTLSTYNTSRDIMCSHPGYLLNNCSSWRTGSGSLETLRNYN